MFSSVICTFSSVAMIRPLLSLKKCFSTMASSGFALVGAFSSIA
jgi:hypothetical protein